MADIIDNNYLLFANFHRIPDAWKLARTFPILELFELQIFYKTKIIIIIVCQNISWQLNWLT